MVGLGTATDWDNNWFDTIVQSSAVLTPQATPVTLVDVMLQTLTDTIVIQL